MYNFVLLSRCKYYRIGADDSVAHSRSHYSRLCRRLCLHEMVQKGKVSIQHYKYRGRRGNGQRGSGKLPIYPEGRERGEREEGRSCERGTDRYRDRQTDRQKELWLLENLHVRDLFDFASSTNLPSLLQRGFFFIGRA